MLEFVVPSSTVDINYTEFVRPNTSVDDGVEPFTFEEDAFQLHPHLSLALSLKLLTHSDSLSISLLLLRFLRAPFRKREREKKTCPVWDDLFLARRIAFLFR
ncbi:hypothetical protein Bca4012_007998 [Brassica carinata]